VGLFIWNFFRIDDGFVESIYVFHGSVGVLLESGEQSFLLFRSTLVLSSTMIRELSGIFDEESEGNGICRSWLMESIFRGEVHGSKYSKPLSGKICQPSSQFHTRTDRSFVELLNEVRTGQILEQTWATVSEYTNHLPYQKAFGHLPLSLADMKLVEQSTNLSQKASIMR